MQRFYLPDRTVFDRYQAGRVRFNLIKGYHRKLAEKHLWFVRPYLSDDSPYYTDGALAAVIEDADDHDFIEVFDCAWKPANWIDTPWKYNVSPKGYTEIYCAERSDPYARGYNVQEIGYKRQPDDVWAIKFYGDHGNSAWISEVKESIRIQRGGIIYRWNGEKHFAGTFGNEVEMKTAPDDVVLPVLRGMNAQKWQGFYEDSIDYVFEITGIRRALL